VFPVPKHLERLADQIDGWLDLRCPDKALALVGPLLGDPAARAAGLERKVRAHVRLGEYPQALADLGELRQLAPAEAWVDLTEAWCRKRTGDLRGAVRCLEQLLARDHKEAVAHFNLGCYLALLGERDRAIDALSLACGLDDGNRDFLRDDADLDGLRTDPRFRALLREERAPRKPATGGLGDDDDLDDDDEWDDDLDGEDDDDGPDEPPRRRGGASRN
jgi:tetratricopeptide (TPR) repeat protein